MLSGRDLKLMRKAQAEALPDLVSIKRAVRQDDGFGGYPTVAEETVAVNVPARITEAQMMNFPGQAAREFLVEKWTIRLPWGTDLRDEDIVEDAAGRRFKVENVKARNWDTAVSASMEVYK